MACTCNVCSELDAQHKKKMFLFFLHVATVADHIETLLSFVTEKIAFRNFPTTRFKVITSTPKQIA